MKLQGFWGTAVRTLSLSRRLSEFHPSTTDTLSERNLTAYGYHDNHLIDPALLPSFIQAWDFTPPRSATGSHENFHAKPLVYSPSQTGKATVYLFSDQISVYAIDADDGTLLSFTHSLTVGELPFRIPVSCGTTGSGTAESAKDEAENHNPDSGGEKDQAESESVDQANGKTVGNDNMWWQEGDTVGITGTPVVDPETDTIFFWAKGYRRRRVDPTASFRRRAPVEGIYRFHAIDAHTLEERVGFPREDVEGLFADNNGDLMFKADGLVQRSSLKLMNGVVYAAFSGACDDSSAVDSGWIVGMRAEDGEPVAVFSASMGSSKGSTVSIVAGVEGQHLFVSGSDYLRDLIVDAEGRLSETARFDPFAEKSLLAGHKELGSFGVSRLPFATSFAKELLLVSDEDGRFITLDGGNLGGEDSAVIQEFSVPRENGTDTSFNGVASYPLEGGYIYFTAAGGKTYAYKLGHDIYGKPLFILDGSSSASAGGDGASTLVTSFDGKDGTGVVWVSDISTPLRAFRAVPEDGILLPLAIPPSPPLGRSQSPVFGRDSYLIISDNTLISYALNPLNPFTCLGPVEVGDLLEDSDEVVGDISTPESLESRETPLPHSRTANVTCIANIPVTQIDGIELVANTPLFDLNTTSIPQGPLSQGQNFSFPVTFRLPPPSQHQFRTTPSVSNTAATNATSLLNSLQQERGTPPGKYSANINLLASPNLRSGVALTAHARTSKPFCHVAPAAVAFPWFVLLPGAKPVHSAFRVANLGDAEMVIEGFGYAEELLEEGFRDSTFVPDEPGSERGKWQLDKNSHFHARSLPIGHKVAPRSSISIDVEFSATEPRTDYVTVVAVYTSGGTGYTVLGARAGAKPWLVAETSPNGEVFTLIDPCPASVATCTLSIDLGESTGPGFVPPPQHFRFGNLGGSEMKVVRSEWWGDTEEIVPLTGVLDKGRILQPRTSGTEVVRLDPRLTPNKGEDVLLKAKWRVEVSDSGWGIHEFEFIGTAVEKLGGGKKTKMDSSTKTASTAEDTPKSDIHDPIATMATTAIPSHGGYGGKVTVGAASTGAPPFVPTPISPPKGPYPFSNGTAATSPTGTGTTRHSEHHSLNTLSTGYNVVKTGTGSHDSSSSSIAPTGTVSGHHFSNFSTASTPMVVTQTGGAGAGGGPTRPEILGAEEGEQEEGVMRNPIQDFLVFILRYLFPMLYENGAQVEDYGGGPEDYRSGLGASKCAEVDA